MKYQIDTDTLSYATVRQLEYIAAIEAAKGDIAKAAKKLGLSPNTLERSMQALRAKASRQGHAPGHFDNGVAPGYAMGKVTVQRNADGQIERTWERQSPDEAQRAALLEEAIEVLAQPIKGLAPIVKGPSHVEKDLMCVIPVGDPHFGLYVWAQECGADFDTDIARKLSIAAADRLIDSMPNCSEGILLLLGDITHANDQTNATPGHKHQLDVDSRFVKVIGITIQTWRHVLLRMKQKCLKVTGKLMPGNHDPQAVWALSYALSAYFSNDPSIQIDLGPSKFWYYQFGKVLLGSTHGDTVKPEKLPSIMAADKPMEWGMARHRYWYTGHIHSKNAMEFPGVQWESFRTLAPGDSYASAYGYRSGRDMVAIVHHREHGEIERHRCDVGML
jgi:hypothetical protein